MKHLMFLLVGIMLFFHVNAQIINRLEYSVDSDPGIGNATPVSFANESMDEYSFSVDLNALDEGIHKLYYRVRDTLGNWSHTYNRVFVKTDNDIVHPRDSIVFEYFFDEQTALLDGKTSYIDTASWDGEFSLTAPVEDLEDGIHTLYYRVRDKRGQWSQTYNRAFVKTDDDVVAPQGSVVFEYFFDKQTALLAGKTSYIDTANWDDEFTLNAPVEMLEQGIHKLYYRFRGKNGHWSQTYNRTFLKERLQTDLAPGIEYLEYHLNEDKGFGNGVSVDISEYQGDSIEFVADITGLTDTNRIFIYARDEFNQWSYEYLDTFCVETAGSLTADFTADTTSGDAPLEVRFTDQSTGYISEWNWDFDGDGTVDASVQHPAHVYDQPGVYTVSLTVSDSTNTDTRTRNDYITVYESGEPLSAGFTADNTTGNAPLEVSFTDESTGDIVSRGWDFDGDGVFDSEAENPVYVYEQPGTYTVILSVSDGSDTDTQTRNDLITVYSEVTLQAGFMADTTSGPAPLKVHFTDQSTGNVTSWKWDFYGNGEVDTTLQHPVYEFSEPGEYTVRLTVSDGSNSDTETKEGYIEVRSSTSIISPVAEHLVKVFPNPTSDRVGVYIENYTEVKRLEILSLEGIRINEYTREELSKDLMSVNLGDQSSGIYLFVIYFENEVITRKLIKK